MELNQGLIYTNSNCVGCHRCISGCPVLGANVSVKTENGNHIYVDNDKCLHCGRCLTNCHHNAREFRDDTSRFLTDLKRGEPISLLVAPSFLDNGSNDDERKRAVIKNIISMAHELGMTIVSEGIETERELEYMKDLNSDFAQGYLFDKPLTRDEFEKRLIQRYYPLNA